ncbi:MAG TPA: class I SAM-dependent methyltransferase, partial [Thermomicrobiales bacterium]
MTVINPNVEVFNRDVANNEGYRYTTNIRLSSQLATQRSTDTILGLDPFTDRSVVDVGCGDDFYTLRFWDAGRPRSLSGVDSAERAIALANTRKGDRPIDFQVGDAHRLPYPDDSFDLALVQSILHHDDNPQDIIREAFRVAPEILIHEPNGYNVG